MIITHVTLQDYGVYKGKNGFNFTCKDNRPIILIGGTNGAGKTTLFESIMLCLYGMTAMGNKITRKEYEKFLSRKIHRYLKSTTSADHASITVQFKFFHNGEEVEYQVERSWIKESGIIDESLEIKKRSYSQQNFEFLNSIEKTHWQSFIEDLIPKGIVKMFFFDGEKIVNMAKEGTEDIAIKESFKSLLGIEIVEQMNTDLQVNLARNLTDNDKTLREDFEKYKSEKDECLANTNRLRGRLAQKQNEMDTLRMEISTQELHISKIGGKFAKERDSLKAQLASKKTDYAVIHQRLISLCAGILPFSMIPTKLDELAEQIQKDESIQQQVLGQKLVNSKIKEIRSHMKTKQFWKEAGIGNKDITRIVSTVSDFLSNESKMHLSNEKIVFGFSIDRTARIKEMIDHANTVTLKNLEKDTEQIVKIGEHISRLESTIASAPKDDEIGSMVTKIGELRSQEGTLQAEMDHIEQKISAYASMKQHLDAKLRDLMNQIYKTKKSKLQIELTHNVQDVLTEFIEKLRAKKILLLEQYLLDAMGLLMHKKNFIEKVSVNPETFEITLFRRGGDPFPKDLLSEGEKQMFAMAILWALAKTSGRPLPFMIDTPLARLDESHRSNIVENFLPVASHQTVIFSTDTEINSEYYKKIWPHLTRAYAMKYVDNDGTTKKHEGYFWDKVGKRIVAV